MADSTINVLSLCSGVGMLDEGLCAGLRYLGYRSRVLGYVERDAYAAACLLARMEDAALEPAPVWCGNLEDLDAESFRGHADIVCAGFPCQPWSHAGKREGAADERWLWPDIARIVRDSESGLVFLENVPGLVSGGGLHFVLDDLTEMGFDAEWCHIAASALGASHKRERVFILAHAERFRLASAGRDARGIRSPERAQESRESKPWSGSRNTFNGGRQLADSTRRGLGELWQPPECDGQPDGSNGALDYASHGQHQGKQEAAGDWQQRINPESSRDVDHATGSRCSQAISRADIGAVELGWQCLPRNGRRDIFAPGPSDPRWPAILAESHWLAPAVKPGVRVLADGMALELDASRADQLRCGGNGVVALQAAAAFVELFRRVMP